MARTEWQVEFDTAGTPYTLGGAGVGTGVTTGVLTVTGMGQLVVTPDTPLLFSAGSVVGVPSYPGRVIGVQFWLQGTAIDVLDDMAALRGKWATSLIGVSVRLANQLFTWDQAVTRSLDFDLSRMDSHGLVRGDCSVLTRFPTPDSGTWT